MVKPVDQFRNRCKARAVFKGRSSKVLQALLEVGSGPLDLGGYPGGGVVNGNAAGEGVHEGFGKAGEVDGLEALEERGEVERSTAGHL